MRETVGMVMKCLLLSTTELYYDRGNHHEFTSLVKELARPGDLMQSTSYDFDFVQVEKPYESYTGANVRLRYEFVIMCAGAETIAIATEI